MPASARQLFGTDEPVESPVPLRAGPLTLSLRRGRLRHIACDGIEVWHGLAFVFRDEHWRTPEPVFDRVDVDARDDSFSATLDGSFPVTPPIRLHLRIDGDADGRIRFAATATVDGDIRSNRIGLCLMHPLAAAGAPVEIVHDDGRTSRSTMPTLIAPWPPFTLIRSIAHRWRPGRWARCDFAGDVFEIEDQRNNADASFKTYSRSNMAPRPFVLAAGDVVTQGAELSLSLSPARTSTSTPTSTPTPTRTPKRGPAGAASAMASTVHIGAVGGDMPAIGITIAEADAGADDDLLAALADLQPAQLHLALRPGRIDAVDWNGIAALLAAGRCRLRIDLDVGRTNDAVVVVDRLAARLRAASIDLDCLAVFPGDRRSVAAARAAFPGITIGGGTPHFFVQLNRLEGIGDVDFASFTTSAIVHGADDDDIMLGLQSLPGMVDTWRARHPATPLRIGPCAIAAHASPLGEQAASDGTRRIALAAVDPRGNALFGAAWALGVAATLVPSGIAALTLLDLCGASGLMGRGADGRIEHRASALVLRSLVRPGRWRRVGVDEAARVAAIVIDRDGPGAVTECLVANLGAEPVDLRLRGWSGPARVAVVDGTTTVDDWPAAATVRRLATIVLPAYAIARVTSA